MDIQNQFFEKIEGARGSKASVRESLRPVGRRSLSQERKAAPTASEEPRLKKEPISNWETAYIVSCLL